MAEGERRGGDPNKGIEERRAQDRLMIGEVACDVDEAQIESVRRGGDPQWSRWRKDALEYERQLVAEGKSS